MNKKPTSSRGRFAFNCLVIVACLCFAGFSFRDHWREVFPVKQPWVAPPFDANTALMKPACVPMGWEVDGMAVYGCAPHDARELEPQEILKPGDFLLWPGGLVTRIGAQDWRIGWPASVWIEPGAKVFRE